MTEPDEISETAPPEKPRTQRRASGSAKGPRSASGDKQHRGVSKKYGKAKVVGQPAILSYVLSFPGRVIATATMCVILIALGHFVGSFVRKVL